MIGTIWFVHGDDFYLIDLLRVKLAYLDLKRLIAEQARRYAANSVVIEDAGSGIPLIRDLRRESGVPY